MIDLTLPLHAGGLAPPSAGDIDLQHRKTHDTDGMQSSNIRLSTHAGTHIDAPLHYAAGGRSVDELTLDECTGEAAVFDLRQHSGAAITDEILAGADPGITTGERVVLITGDVDRALDGEWEYPHDIHKKSAALTLDAAEWLIDKGVSQVASDFLTESMRVTDLPYDSDRPVHRALLGADLSIVEYLCNTADIVTHERVRFDCYPLPIVGAEASPCRVAATSL